MGKLLTISAALLFLAGVTGNPALNIADQIHPTEDGYKIIIEKNIWPVLEPIIQ